MPTVLIMILASDFSFLKSTEASVSPSSSAPIAGVEADAYNSRWSNFELVAHKQMQDTLSLSCASYPLWVTRGPKSRPPANKGCSFGLAGS